jgi:glycosyltransferase involved in cell wall biosynthesis
VYNSHEEKSLINRVSDNQHVPGLIVGVGSEIPESFDVEGFLHRHAIRAPYALYIGRLDENKGVPELLDFFLRLQKQSQHEFHLVLIGKAWIPVPEHPRIHYLGFMPDREKFNALKGSAFLVNPSQFESLSMVALEAWALGKPVMANGRTEVLRGQCLRSNAGLWYTSYEEFLAIWERLISSESLREKLGENGRRFFKENYAWPEIRRKYQQVFSTLAEARSGSGQRDSADADG